MVAELQDGEARFGTEPDTCTVTASPMKDPLIDLLLDGFNMPWLYIEFCWRTGNSVVADQPWPQEYKPSDPWRRSGGERWLLITTGEAGKLRGYGGDYEQ